MIPDETVFVTGANGFVGRHVCQALVGSGYRVLVAVRDRGRCLDLKSMGCEPVAVGDIGGDTDWTQALRGVNRVVHLAARVHVMDERKRNSLEEYRRVNVLGTQRLAEQAAAAGVRRLVYLSSIKVNGETTVGRQVMRESDPPAPQDPYGQSKWEAEQVLHRVADGTGLEVVILRPPLIYGPGVGANFLALMKAVSRGVPMPLGSIHNARSLLYVGNLVNAIALCLQHPDARGQTYLVTDGEDISTPALVQKLAAALDRPVRLISVPTAILGLAGALTGRRAVVARLAGSLVVDSSKIRRDLSWQPPYSLEEGLRVTAEAYRLQSRRDGSR